GCRGRWKNQNPDAPAILQHSSGSTGLQKGVQLSHSMVIQQCEAYARHIHLDPQRDKICSWIPLYHDMGLFTSWLLPLICRVPVAAMDPFSWIQAPLAFFDLIKEFKGTLCWQPNFAFQLLAMRAAANSEYVHSLGNGLSTMRGFTSCSEPVRAEAMEMFY